MRAYLIEFAENSGANIVTPFPGKGAGGIAHQMIMSLRFLMGFHS
jgi:hypothetical protein